MKPKDHRLLLAGLAFVFAAGCNSRTVKPQQSYDKLKPIGVAPQTSSTPTLVVQINNVRDHGKSRKNSAALFINDQEITPSNAQQSNPRDNIYELSLASGVYKIEAVYRAQSFWKAKSFKITTQDGKVRVYPDHITTLAITLDKKPDGALQRQKNFFSEIPQPVFTGTALKSSAPAADKPSAPILLPLPQASQAQPQARASIVEITSPVQPAAQPTSPPAAGGGQAVPARSGKIALQINTSPSNAEVIVDNKYLGQSPLVTYVDRGQNHVIQISKSGHATTIKVLEHREFGNQDIYFFIEKLEAQR